MAGNIRLFASAVHEHGGTIAFGTTASTIGAVAAHFGLPDVNSAPGWVLVTGLFLTVVVACFRAWRDEHSARIAADERFDSLTKPQLGFEFLVTICGLTPRGPVITIEGAVRNTGAPSICDGYQLVVIALNGERIQTKPVMSSGAPITLNFDFGGTRTYTSANFLANITAVSPIATGSKARGILMFLADGSEQHAVFAVGTKFELSFADVSGAKYLANHKVTAHHQEQMINPGINPIIQR